MGDVIIDGGTGANRLVILDANGKIPALDGSAVTNVPGANFTTGAIPVARIDTGSTAGKVVQLDGSAKLPAVSGAALTGIVSATKNASDPTISSNPSGGVGTEWQNTTTGSVFICTDATAGENVWKNVGAGTGDVEPWYVIRASTSYFTVAGDSIAGVDRNAFASDANSTDWGDVTVARGAGGTTSSTTHGYYYGGWIGSNTNIIDKFTMASAANSTDVGDMTYQGHHIGCMTGPGYGYTAGGYPGQDQINKHSYASDGNATDIGNSRTSYAQRGGQSQTYGYMLGGTSPHNSIIAKIKFSDDTYTSSVGNLRGTVGFVGCTCTADGYVFVLGGTHGQTAIDKISTASDSTSVATGATLLVGIDIAAAGANSSSTGYVGGGGVSGNTTQIQKFSLSISSGTSTDVGDLTVGHTNTGGCQY